MTNIHLYIGYNTADKTKYLKNLISKLWENKISVVENVINTKNGIVYVPDNDKKNHLLENADMYMRNILLGKGIEKPYDAYISELLKFLYSKGDVLVIDELDLTLLPQHIIDVCTLISLSEDLWKEIHISGYDDNLICLFKNSEINKEYNVYTIKGNTAVKLKSESEIYESFD